MRYSGSWQSVWDDRILEIIAEEGPSSPKTIEETNIVHISRQHISNRLGTLADHGLLMRLPNGVYAMSEKGEAYLSGEYDAEAEQFIEDPEDYSLGSEQEGVNGT